jgi:DNA ligase (NAD+)
MSDIQKENLIDLYKQADLASRAYYLEQSPVISDDDYDTIIKDIRTIENEHPEWVTADSPTQRVGGEVSGGFKKEKHPLPILSLANAYSKEELGAWIERISKLDDRVKTGDFVIEPKFDGLTVVLHYQDGVFVKGVTRGDGLTGEDVTSNIKTIKTVPMRLKGEFPNKLVVRGEAIIENDDFLKLNAEIAAKGGKPYLTPRNTASGALRNIDPKVTASRPLKVFVYAIIDEEDNYSHLGQMEKLTLLGKAGFNVYEDTPVCGSLDEIWKVCERFAEKRSQMAFDIDGVVIKVNNSQLMDSLGVSGKDPRGAMAYKFPAKEKATQLLEIGLQVGRGGVITPVAIMAPVEIGGVTVERATLHNFAYIESHDIRIGDTILVKRAGDVIPYVQGVLFDARTGQEKVYARPTACPECGSTLEASETDIALYCKNEDCPARILRSLQLWVSKGRMEILSLGDKIIESLYSSGMVKDVADFYLLTRDDLLKLEGFADKKADNILKAIEDSRTRPMAAVLNSLLIEGVGESTAEDIAVHFPDFQSLRKITREQLLQIENIGEKTADTICEWFSDPKNITLLEKLEGHLHPASQAAASTVAKFKGQTFVITGTLSQPRSYYEKIIKANGGLVTDSVSKKTSYLLLGENPGSKLAKAQKNGVAVISEDEFETLMR